MKVIVLFLFLLFCSFFYFSFSRFTPLKNVHVVSFSHNCCKKAQENLERTALLYGANKVHSITLDTLVAQDNVKDYIRNSKRGAGYWIWKPYALKQILNKSNPDDIVIYVDSGTYFNKNMKNIINYINRNNILCFKHSPYEKQSQWTKLNAVKYFGYPDNWCSTQGKNNQIMAAFVGVKNNTFGNTLVDEWLQSMNPSNQELFDDSPSEHCSDFKESRHDQQMLSLLIYKKGLQFPTYNREKYGWVWHEKINGNNRHE